MALTKNEIIKLKENLFDLRKDHKYTLQKLSDEFDKQGFDLSSTNLGNYEITEQTHENYNRTEGMSVKNLIILADFYGVSVDYLLGRAECTTPTNEKIKDITGLSDKAITVLKYLKISSECKDNAFINSSIMLQILNYLIEQEIKWHPISIDLDSLKNDNNKQLYDIYMQYSDKTKDNNQLLFSIYEFITAPFNDHIVYMSKVGKLYSEDEIDNLSIEDGPFYGYGQNFLLESALLTHINDIAKNCRNNWHSENGGDPDGKCNEEGE